jgi:hypothetical protein
VLIKSFVGISMLIENQSPTKKSNKNSIYKKKKVFKKKFSDCLPIKSSLYAKQKSQSNNETRKTSKY